MNSKDYWQKREDEALKHYIRDEKAYEKELHRIYGDMLDSVQEQINSFYGKYAAAEGITIAEAKRRVRKLDIAAYERKAAKYVREKNFSKQANEEMRLYNLTMKINRFEMLKANIGLELIAGHDELEKFMEEILQGRTVEELERQAGILGKTVRDNAKSANAIVNSSFHNAKFSDRIWMHQSLLRDDLDKLLQSGLIQGKNPRVLAREIKKKFDVSTYNAERLMRTELARVQTEAQKQSFERNGFEKYEFIVNSGCCSVCQGLSGKRFRVEKMMPGENAPPMHPHCRCSTAAYEDSKEYEAWLDYLANGGTTEEWNAKGKDVRLNANPAKNDKFSDAGFKTINGEHSFIDDLTAVNPNYGKSEEYCENCSHTVPAYEMRRRGYDVVATGAKNKDKYKQAGMRAWGYADHATACNSGAVHFVQAKRSASIAPEIAEAITNAGDGARFEIRVGWKRGGGHFFVGENIGGKAVFIDPQSGEHGASVEDYFASSKPSGTWYTRIDNIDLDPGIMKDICEVRK